MVAGRAQGLPCRLQPVNGFVCMGHRCRQYRFPAATGGDTIARNDVLHRNIAAQGGDLFAVRDTGIPNMVIPVFQLRQHVAGQPVGLVAPQARFFLRVFTIRMDDNIHAAQPTDAVLDAPRPFICCPHPRIAVVAQMANHLRSGAIGTDDVLSRTLDAVKQRGRVHRLYVLSPCLLLNIERPPVYPALNHHRRI